MNIPNLLTILRIFFVPLLVAALVQERVALHFRGATITNVWLALAIFLVRRQHRPAGRLPGAPLASDHHHRHAARSHRR
jgi:hypothetical protein